MKITDFRRSVFLQETIFPRTIFGVIHCTQYFLLYSNSRRRDDNPPQEWHSPWIIQLDYKLFNQAVRRSGRAWVCRAKEKYLPHYKILGGRNTTPGTEREVGVGWLLARGSSRGGDELRLSDSTDRARMYAWKAKMGSEQDNTFIRVHSCTHVHIHLCGCVRAYTYIQKWRRVARGSNKNDGIVLTSLLCRHFPRRCFVRTKAQIAGAPSGRHWDTKKRARNIYSTSYADSYSSLFIYGSLWQTFLPRSLALLSLFLSVEDPS